MTYQQWVQQTDINAFKTSIINSLTALKFNNPDLNAALLDKVLEMINNRYQDRTLWPTPVKFQGMLANDLINSLPVFVNNLKKYSFWAQYTDPTKFGKQVTDNGRMTEQGTSESTDRETSTNEHRSTSNNTDTSTSNANSSSVEGGTPINDPTTFSPYEQTKDTSESTENHTINETETSNDNGTYNTTSNTSDNNTRTHEKTINELDWQKAIAELSNEHIWHLHSERLVSQLEYLFVGVSYYEF